MNDYVSNMDKITKMLNSSKLIKGCVHKVIDIGTDKCVVETSTGKSKVPLGGGALFSLADMICCIALWDEIQDSRKIFSTHMSWVCYRPLCGEKFLFIARVVARHSTQCFVELEVLKLKRNNEGKNNKKITCAKVTTTVYRAGKRIRC